ncbi:MAG TPA: hypothetical protein VE465_01965 [Streptosporangiaceae bacterium]|nr:hypothetical protein [Streptosporangiaceae bacterium]
MKHADNIVIVKRYRTAGGGVTLVHRHPGWWRRYTWWCPCGQPRSRRRMARRMALARAYNHAVGCDTTPSGAVTR